MKNFKKVLTGILTTAMMVGCFSVGNLLAVVKDPNEPNNDWDKAVELKKGELVLGEIGDHDTYMAAGQKSDEDWYKFKVEKGKKYKICVTGKAGRFKPTTLLIYLYTSEAEAKKKDMAGNLSYHCGAYDCINYGSDGMDTNNRDWYEFTAPSTNTCYIRLHNYFLNPGMKSTVIDTTFYTISIDGMYKDVKNFKDFWYDPTYYLAGLGVVKGYDNGTKFKPDNDCTRAQMVTFLWRLKGSPKPKTKSTKFTDIKKGDYYYNAVLWAVENGITTGTSKTTFGPSGVCTRGQTVTFLWRMAGKPSVGNAKCKFSDVKKGAYYYDAVIWASKQKIVAGYKDGTFQPDNKCARRQMVTFLYKYDKYINGKG